MEEINLDENKSSSIEVFEDLLKIIGTRGKRNIVIIILASCIGLVFGMNVFSYQFIGATPDHWCSVDELSNISWTPEQIRNISVPLKTEDGETKFSQCEKYDFNFSTLSHLTYDEALGFMDDWKARNNETVSCSKRYYNKEAETVVTKWDLTCERRYLYVWTQGAAQIGLFVGSPLSGFLMDKYGRKQNLKFCTALFFGSSLLTYLVSIIDLFILIRFLATVAAIGLYMSVFVTVMELCLPEERSMVGNYFIIPWALGIMLTPVIAYFVRYWIYLQTIIFIPSLTILVNLWTTPESPRWLIMNGNHEQAYNILESIANSNNKSIPKKEVMLGAMKTIQKMGPKKQMDHSSILERMKRLKNQLTVLFTTRQLRRKSILVFYCWFAAATVYYGVSLGSETVTDNAYLYVFIGGVLELVSYLSLWPAVVWMGRKLSLLILFAMTGVSIVAAMILLIAVNKNELYALKLILYFIGKFAITAAFQLIWVWTAELYPTKLRSIAVGEASSFSRIGSTSSPFINELLGAVKIWIPACLYGTISLLAALCTLMLEETSKLNLKDHIDLKDETAHENPGFTGDDLETSQNHSIN